jgi:hypothetical protein
MIGQPSRTTASSRSSGAGGWRDGCECKRDISQSPHGFASDLQRDQTSVRILIPSANTGGINMKWIRTAAMITSCCVLVLTTISKGQQTPQKPQPVTPRPQSLTKSFSVNGKPVQTSLQIDNRTYIALDDLTSSLDGSLTKRATTIDLTVPVGNCSHNAGSSDAVNGAGMVKGTFTYYFNENYGNRPDVGAKVWIIKGENISIPESDWVFGDSRSELLLEDDRNQKINLPISLAPS